MSFGRDKEGAGMYKAKLRLNYELKPLAFVLKNAGGSATNGYEDILDILPSQLHERQPVVMGNSDIGLARREPLTDVYANIHPLLNLLSTNAGGASQRHFGGG